MMGIIHPKWVIYSRHSKPLCCYFTWNTKACFFSSSFSSLIELNSRATVTGSLSSIQFQISATEASLSTKMSNFLGLASLSLWCQFSFVFLLPVINKSLYKGHEGRGVLNSDRWMKWSVLNWNEYDSRVKHSSAGNSLWQVSWPQLTYI